MFPGSPPSSMDDQVSRRRRRSSFSKKAKDEALRTAQTEKASKSVTFLSQQSKAENDGTSRSPPGLARFDLNADVSDSSPHSTPHNRLGPSSSFEEYETRAMMQRCALSSPSTASSPSFNPERLRPAWRGRTYQEGLPQVNAQSGSKKVHPIKALLENELPCTAAILSNVEAGEITVAEVGKISRIAAKALKVQPPEQDKGLEESLFTLEPLLEQVVHAGFSSLEGLEPKSEGMLHARMHMDRIALASNGNSYADRNEKAVLYGLASQAERIREAAKYQAELKLARHGLVAENAGREHFAPTGPKSYPNGSDRDTFVRPSPSRANGSGQENGWTGSEPSDFLSLWLKRLADTSKAGRDGCFSKAGREQCFSRVAGGQCLPTGPSEKKDASEIIW